MRPRQSVVVADAGRIALRYVPQFVCLAGDCKENCCSGLRVELSDRNFAHLAARADGTALEAKVDRLVQLEPPATRSARTAAYIEAGGGACPFLDPDWLCSIHRTLGEDALADPCSLFPRVLAEVHARHELSATLACPEAARLCLTLPGAVDLVPLAQPAMAREIVVRRHDASSADPYLACFDDIRQACIEVMNADAVRVPVRLLLLVDLADRIAPFFHRETTTFEVDALRAALEELPARVAAIQARFDHAPAADVRAVRAMKEMLVARLPGCDNARFNARVRPLVLRDVTAGTTELVAYFHGGAQVAVSDQELRARILAVHARLLPARDAQLDEHARRYVINSIMKDWYTSRPTLGSALRRIVVRLALSRFATLAHPALAEVAGDDARAVQQVDDAAVDDAAIEAFQIIAKNVEHVPPFMELCERYLEEQQLGDLDGLARLLRV